MRFRLSHHAEEEIARRRIPTSIVESVLNNPEQVVPEQRGRHAYQSRIGFGNGSVFLVRAIVADDAEPAVVVTVYRTSRIAKYWSTE